MIFDKKFGNPTPINHGCHPLCAAVDHISPGNKESGQQIICYDLNDLKGHLPHKIFKELKFTRSWNELMTQWRRQTETNNMDIIAFKNILKD